MRVITAPEELNLKENEILCFLAGGISGCENWQDKVISILNSYTDTDNLVLANPRRKEFDITDPTASEKQIQWEFYMLEKADIFSMYFDNSNSVQPICFYELGRNLCKIKNNAIFPSYENRIVVSVREGFSRTNDVVIQTKLALSDDSIVNIVQDIKTHADNIYKTYKAFEASLLIRWEKL